MPLAILVEKWSLFKGTRPQALLESWGEFAWSKRSTTSSSIVVAFQALCKLEEKFRDNHAEVLRFALFPNAVFSACEVKVGTLRLQPHLTCVKR